MHYVLRVISGTLFCLFFFVALPTAAQDKRLTHGRLADGKAYRLDETGVRITDRLAELEVTVDDLQRQIYALENELGEKQRTINKLRKQNDKGAAATATIIERNLGAKELEPLSANSPNATVELERKIAEVQQKCREKMEDGEVSFARMQEEIDRQVRAVRFKEDELSRLNLSLNELQAQLEKERLAKSEQMSKEQILKLEKESAEQLAGSEKAKYVAEISKRDTLLAEKERKIAEQGERLIVLNQELSTERAKQGEMKTTAQQETLNAQRQLEAGKEEVRKSWEMRLRGEVEKSARLEGELITLRAEIANKNSKIALLEGDLQARGESNQEEVSGAKSQIESLESQLAKNRGALTQKDEVLAKLTLQLSEAEKKVRLYEENEKTKLAQASTVKPDSSLLETKRAMLKPTTKEIGLGEEFEEDKTSGIPIDLTGVRQRLNARLAEIQKLIRQRKDLADRLTQRQKGISVSMHQLQSKDGVSLDKLRVQLQGLQDAAQGSQVEIGIGQIEYLLNDDIKMLQRLASRP